MPDAADILMKQHREVEGLFAQFNQEGDASLARTICEEIDRHATLEEQLVYPALERDVDEQMAEEARQEHDEARQLIAKIQQAGAGDDGELRQLVQQLEQAIQHHVEEEEGEVFPAMRERLGEGRMTELADELQAAMAEMPASAGQGAGGAGDELLDLTKDELYEKAKEAEVEGRSKMSKDELAESVKSAE